MLLETGIPKLDDVLGGGLQSNTSVLLWSTPGVRNIEFTQQIVYNRLSQGDHGLYFVNNKKPINVKASFDSYDWSTMPFEDKGVFSFLDGYSNSLGTQSQEKFFVKNVTNMEEIKYALADALKFVHNENNFLIFDALSSLLDICGTSEEVIAGIEDLLTTAKRLNVTSIFLFTEWPYDKSILTKLKELFDCVIELKAVEKRVILRNYYVVSKANWIEKLETREIPFKILKPGGIKVYVPKILVTGPYNAGKSSFVHSASTKAVSVERMGLEGLGTTVALDHGHVDFKGYSADLFGSPGQERFDPLLKMLGSEALGVVVVIDSTNPKSFPRAKDMLEKSKTEGLPVVIVANKANLPGALTEEQIRKKMVLPKDVPILPVVAEDLKKLPRKKEPCKLRQTDVHTVLEKLFERVV